MYKTGLFNTVTNKKKHNKFEMDFIFSVIFLVSVLTGVKGVHVSRILSSRANTGARIIDGQDARAGQFPYVASIHVQTKDSTFFCGGTLISNQYIITSGYCVYNAVLFTIHLGSNTLEDEDPNRLTLATSEHFLHPDFNPETIENDIAIIKLRMPIKLSGYIQPIHISPNHYTNYTTVTAIGFGQTSDSDPKLSDRLKYVKLIIIPNEECKIYYGNQITDNMVCASGNYNEGACTGDTGGPLIIPNQGKYSFLVGVGSFVSGNGCENADPSGFTRIYPYRDWILNITRS